MNGLGQNLYRESKGKIETFVEGMFSTQEKKDSVFSSFFGEKREVLSSDEQNNFELFAKYAQKRILNASLNKEGIERDQISTYLDKYDNSSFMVLHDLSHSIVTYQDGQKSDTTSTTPEFYKTESSQEINNKKLIAEEARAIIWVTVVGDKPVSTMLMDKKGRKAFAESIALYKEGFGSMVDRVLVSMSEINTDDFESYKDTFQDVVYGLVEVTNSRAIDDEKNKLSAEDQKKLKKEYVQIVEELKADPDPRLIQVLKNIFDNRHDEKILYKEFYKICGPLVENLKKRKTI